MQDQADGDTFELGLVRRAQAIRTRSLVAMSAGVFMVGVAAYATWRAIVAEPSPWFPALLACGVLGVGACSAGTFGLLSGAGDATRERTRRVWLTSLAAGLALVAMAITAAGCFVGGFLFVAAASEQEGATAGAWLSALLVVVPALAMSFAAWWQAAHLVASARSSGTWSADQSRYRVRWALVAFGALGVTPSAGWLVFLAIQAA